MILFFPKKSLYKILKYSHLKIFMNVDSLFFFCTYECNHFIVKINNFFLCLARFIERSKFKKKKISHIEYSFIFFPIWVNFFFPSKPQDLIQMWLGLPLKNCDSNFHSQFFFLTERMLKKKKVKTQIEAFLFSRFSQSLKLVKIPKIIIVHNKETKTTKSWNHSFTFCLFFVQNVFASCY